MPIPDFGHVLPVLCDIALMVDQLVAHQLLEVSTFGTQLGHTIDYIHDQVKPVQIV